MNSPNKVPEDSPEEVRERVTKILEGGKEAFLTRERKYRFAEKH